MSHRNPMTVEERQKIITEEHLSKNKQFYIENEWRLSDADKDKPFFVEFLVLYGQDVSSRGTSQTSPQLSHSLTRPLPELCLN